MLAHTLGTAIQALQRLAASNPMLYKALLHMKKDSHGCISAATLTQVSCNAAFNFLWVLRCNTSLHRSQMPECSTCNKFANAMTVDYQCHQTACTSFVHCAVENEMQNSTPLKYQKNLS